MTARSGTAPAVVLGLSATEIVRPLTRTGIPCRVIAPPGDPAGRSRLVTRPFEWDWTAPMDAHDDALVDRFVAYARTERQRPVLHYCSDEPMVFVSRHRARLAEHFDFVVPDADLVEALVDKSRFSRLAEQHDLPVPRTRVLHPDREPWESAADLAFPVVLKPKKRDRRWLEVDPGNSKALRADGPEQLRQWWPALGQLGAPILAQEYVEGPESRMEGYHVYVRGDGRIGASFTGRKLRTMPTVHGHTTALLVTHLPDVDAAGRETVRRLGLRGVAKVDFKRAPDGRLVLLEINARLTLWNHAGAHAGVNIPARVHRDLAGDAPHPVAATPRDASWWHPKDLVAARRHGVDPWAWARWAARSDAVAFAAPTDPLPLVAALARWPSRSRRARGGPAEVVARVPGPVG